MQHTATTAFETQRLICRPFEQGDEKDMFDYWAADPDIQLEAYHRAENAKSGRVFVKSRMHITDTVERFKRAGEQPIGEVCYCIKREEYHRSKEENQ